MDRPLAQISNMLKTKKLKKTQTLFFLLQVHSMVQSMIILYMLIAILLTFMSLMSQLSLEMGGDLN